MSPRARPPRAGAPHRRRPVVWALALVAALGGLAVPALAVAPPAAAVTAEWSVAPGPTAEGERVNYGFVVDPGAVLTDSLVVTNLGAAPLSLGVYAADGFTTETGQLDVLPTGEPSADLGSWVQLELSAVELGAGEQVEVPFTVTVPADAAAGDHSGAVVTSLVSSAGESGVGIDRRLGVRVHLLVSGDLTAGLQVSSLTVDPQPSGVPFGAGSAVVGFTVTNTGNTRLAGASVVRVSGPFGWGTRSVPGEVPELLAGASVPIEVVVQDVGSFGRLTADVALAPVVVGASGVDVTPVAARTTVTAISVPTVAVLVAALAGLGLGGWLLRRRRRGPAPADPAAAHPAPADPAPADPAPADPAPRSRPLESSR